MAAIIYRRFEIAHFLLDRGGYALLVAMDARQFEIVHLLLDRGANALVTDENLWTTILVACRKGADLRLVRRLLGAGVL